tara:strand:+ start:1562 stop:1933 length:372 start_codon:yes stop_codon:yes gene_type:complete
MIFGTFKIGDTLETNNDNYMLASITAVSTRRPFISAGLMAGGLCALFGFGFWDILWPAERLTLSCIAVASVAVGLSIGRLSLASRDLRGTPIADAVYGTYGHLNQKRRELANAIHQINTRGAS